MTAHHNMLQFIATGDHKLMRKVNKWPAPKWIRLWAIAATRAGDGWLWYLVGSVDSPFWRRRQTDGNRLRRLGCACRDCDIQGTETSVRATTPMRSRATLLGQAPAARSVLLSVRSHHYRVCSFHCAGEFYPDASSRSLFCALSIAASRILLGHALLKRRPCGRVARGGPGAH